MIIWEKLNPIGNKPSPRYFHSICECNNKMYLFGGQGFDNKINNEIWEYDTITNTWTDKNPSKKPNKKRLIGNILSYNNEIYVFGGEDTNPTTDSFIGVTNDIWKYNPITNIWTLLEPSGNKPIGRLLSANVLIDNYIYVFGGQALYDNRWTAINDLWKYDILENKWIKIETDSKPLGRYGASVLYYNGKIYLFGGNNTNNIYYNDIWVYDIQNNTWNEIETNMKPPTSTCNTGFFIYNGKIYLFGGNNEYGTISEVWSFNTLNNIWKKETKIIKYIKQYLSHGTAIINNKFYYFGGKDETFTKITDTTFVVSVIDKTFLIKQNKTYHTIKSNLHLLGQPTDNIQLKTWYERYGVDNVNILTQSLNNKDTPMTKDETTGIWKTDFQLDANDIVDNVQLVEVDENNKIIKYDCNEYRILDLVNDEFEIKMLKG